MNQVSKAKLSFLLQAGVSVSSAQNPNAQRYFLKRKPGSWNNQNLNVRTKLTTFASWSLWFFHFCWEEDGFSSPVLNMSHVLRRFRLSVNNGVELVAMGLNPELPCRAVTVGDLLSLDGCSQNRWSRDSGVWWDLSIAPWLSLQAVQKPRCVLSWAVLKLVGWKVRALVSLNEMNCQTVRVHRGYNWWFDTLQSEEEVKEVIYVMESPATRVYGCRWR